LWRSFPNVETARGWLVGRWASCDDPPSSGMELDRDGFSFALVDDGSGRLVRDPASQGTWDVDLNEMSSYGMSFPGTEFYIATKRSQSESWDLSEVSDCPRMLAFGAATLVAIP
jgi:hypothetical protein